MMRNEATGHRKLTLKTVFIFRRRWQSWAACGALCLGGRVEGEMERGISLPWISAGFGGVSFKIPCSDRLSSSVTASGSFQLSLCASLIFCCLEKLCIFGTAIAKENGHDHVMDAYAKKRDVIFTCL